jgi:hypothetical protein
MAPDSLLCDVMRTKTNRSSTLLIVFMLLPGEAANADEEPAENADFCNTRATSTKYALSNQLARLAMICEYT